MRGRVCVWIVNYNSAGYLPELIERLVREGVDEVIILDNLSPNAGEWEAVRNLADRFAAVKALRGDHNRGFGGGHNYICRAVPGRPDDIIWMLNPDTQVPSGVVASLREVIESGEAEVVSPLIVTGANGDKRIWFAGGEIDRRRGLVRDRYAGNHIQAIDADVLLRCGFITGAAPMMRRWQFESLGGFAADLFLYWEDVDFSLRALDAGLRLAVNPAAVIWHSEGGSTKQTSRTRSIVYYYSARNRVIVCRRSWLAGWSIAFGAGLVASLRLFGHAVVKGGRGRSGRAVAVIRGTAAGVSMRARPVPSLDESGG